MSSGAAEQPNDAPEPRDLTATLMSADATGGSAERIVPLVYAELRALAAAWMAREPAGHTLQPTALVNEAYLRLVKGHDAVPWANRRHFFAAAATAMRRVLVERARRAGGPRRGGGRGRVPLQADAARTVSALERANERDDGAVLSLDRAVDALTAHDPAAAEVVMLRYFAGLTAAQTAAAMAVSERTVHRHWTYAKAWLLDTIGRERGRSTTEP